MNPLPSSLFQGPSNSSRFAIRCLIPDLPTVSELLPRLERIEQNRWYSNFGPLLLEYESALAEMLGAPCVTLSSGTAALELGIAALGLPSGSRVALPAFAFPAPLLAVLRCGLTPVFCDVCPDTWTLTPEIAIEALAHGECKLVVPVATFGHPLPTEAWDRFVQTTGVAVLIDAAPALGMQRVGKLAHAAFSLHATKPLGIGEGGVFATSDAQLAERVRRASNYGFADGVVAHPGGTNAKLSEYAAAVGLAQLERWPRILERRLSIWRRYSDALNQLPGARIQAGLIELPPTLLSVHLPVDASHAAGNLAAAGIETRRWYLPPLHHQPLFAGMDRLGPNGGTTLPVTENIAAHHLGLPFHAYLSEGDISSISQALCACLR